MIQYDNIGPIKSILYKDYISMSSDEKLALIAKARAIYKLHRDEGWSIVLSKQKVMKKLNLSQSVSSLISDALNG